MAAESTLAAGKTHFASLGVVVLGVQTTTPTCREEVDQSSAIRIRIANGLRAMGNAYSDNGTTTTNCSPAGNGVQCATTPGLPSIQPEYKTVCEGGGVLQWIDYAESFEFLDENEAARRNDPLIPGQKRPFNAHRVLSPTKASRSSPPNAFVDPFAE